MSGARAGEDNVAAASSATVQQAGIAFGAAIAGLVANASGLGSRLDIAAMVGASIWVPLILAAAPFTACAIGIRLNVLTQRDEHKQVTAATSA